jgi:hypothetical protein
LCPSCPWWLNSRRPAWARRIVFGRQDAAPTISSSAHPA